MIPSAAASRSLFVLLCALRSAEKPVSTRGRGGRFILSEPVCATCSTPRVAGSAGCRFEPGQRPRPGAPAGEILAARMTAPVIRDEHLLDKQLAGWVFASATIGT